MLPATAYASNEGELEGTTGQMEDATVSGSDLTETTEELTVEEELLSITAIDLSCPGYVLGGSIADAVPTTATDGITISAYEWQDDSETALTDGTFAADTQYRLQVFVKVEDGYTADSLEEANVKIDGEEAAYFTNPCTGEDALKGDMEIIHEPAKLAAPQPVTAIEDTSITTELATTGSGTEADPYIVTDYDELRDLMLNAQNYTTRYIKLGSDINYSESTNDHSLKMTNYYASVVLDLNGYTISRSGLTTDLGIVYLSTGNLTIRDSSSAGTGKMTSSVHGGGTAATLYVFGGGNLTIDGGTFEVTDGTYPKAIYTQGGTTQINGGTFINTTKKSETANFYYGIVTVDGGTFIMETDVNERSYGMYILPDDPKVYLCSCTIIGGGKAVLQLNGTEIPTGCSRTETTIDGQNAVIIAPEAGSSITSLSVTDMTPVDGAFPEVSPTAGADSYEVKIDKWYNAGTVIVPGSAMSASDAFVAEKSYIAEVRFTAKEGYVIRSNRSVTINGEPAYFCANLSSGGSVVYRAVLKAPVDIKEVAMTSDISAPVIGFEVTTPTFTITEGDPVFVKFGNWQKYDATTSTWNDYSGTTFEAGKYRYRATLRLSSADCKKALMNSGVTATVNGVSWDVDNKITLDGTDKLVQCTAYSTAYTAVTKYKVSFNANGGTGTMNDIIVNGGTESTSYKLPPNGFTAPAGKQFKGWATSPDGTTVYAPLAKYSITSNKTFYAIWEDRPKHAITVTDGKATVDGVEVSQASEGITVTLTANAAPDGHVFEQWVVESGSITLADATSATTTFVMPESTVSVKATYKTLPIENANCTITVPVAGATPDFNPVSSDSSKYSVTLDYWYLYETPYPHLSSTDVFVAGKVYALRVKFTPNEGYSFADNTVFTINGEKTDAYGIVGYRHVEFRIPMPKHTITVTDGKATAGGVEVSEAEEGTTVTLTANAAPDGKVFDKWEVVSGSITLADETAETTTFVMPESTVSVKATYKTPQPIDSVDVTITKLIPGTSPKDAVSNTKNVTVTKTTWYHGENMLSSSDSFEEGETYRVKVTVQPDSGYAFAENPTVTFNGSTTGKVQYAYDDVIFYSAEFTAAYDGIIDSVDVTITKPVAGAHPQNAVSNTENVSVAYTFWYNNSGKLVSATDTFEAGKIYRVKVFVQTDSGYALADNPTVTFNGSIKGTVLDAFKDVIAYSAKFTVSTYQIDEIPDLTYTGKVLKPVVKVYDEGVLLKAGKDYTLTYVNNKNANAKKADGSRMMKVGDGIFGSMSDEGFNPDLPYVIIKGKGNYQKEIYVNFNILPPVIGDGSAKEADGVVLKFTDHTEANGKLFKPLTSIKCGKITMKAGVDYEVKVAKAGEPVTNLLNAKGQMEAVEGTYLMTIKGIGNFDGEIVKTISVAAKPQLLKNAKIKLNIKSKEFDYLDPESDNTTLADSDYTVTIADGKTTKVLVKDTDFTVSYRNNDKVGTATLVLNGKDPYVGSKTITFKITGTALTGKNVEISNVSDQTYTGKAIEQDAKLVLTKADKTKVNLVSGKDYTVTYQNNLKKGTATMTFKGNADAGYTGSVKKTFKINVANLTDVNVASIGSVPYAKAGATADAKVVLTYNGIKLIKGKDYTLKYTDNKDLGEATVTITGKGNFTGSLTKTFTIVKQDMANTVITIKPLAYNAKDSYVYKLSVTVKDGKSNLKNGTDYAVEFASPSKTDLDLWLAGDASKAPKAVIKAAAESCYTGSVEVPVSIYNVKLSGNNTYVKVDDSTNIYNGAQQLPKTVVYFSTDKAVIQELNAAEKAGTLDTVIADKLAAGKIKVLNAGTDYTVSGGKNIFAGPNKGVVKISGTGMYSGSVSKKFTIQKKDIWWK